MSTPEGNIRLHQDGQIATILIDRPAKLNALTPFMLNELEAVVRELDARTDVRAVILTGAGERAFCVGADINQWSSLEPLGMWRSWVRNGHRIFDALAQLRMPVIAAINHHAFGGGLELAATADIRIADPSATFALPEAGIATCPGWSGTQRLVGLVGVGAVKLLAFTGRKINAEEARRIGLIQEISAAGQVLPHARQMAEEIARQAPVSVQLTKQLIDAGQGVGLAMTLEAMAGALSATTKDAKEGLRSFQEKLKPGYQGE
ncbi:enoyl-CoA hydratase/isomerase family protein [Leeia oryzae]|uniref:enoyl-CoA hydratase/isomerase family protein n=1 Tax=Leeia oryzae TaxID=356662 RepID=UPI00035F1548|nr:enoyl-CoA hydratase/isomerase family protein [Leeia oryzae]